MRGIVDKKALRHKPGTEDRERAMTNQPEADKCSILKDKQQVVGCRTKAEKRGEGGTGIRRHLQLHRGSLRSSLCCERCLFGLACRVVAWNLIPRENCCPPTPIGYDATVFVLHFVANEDWSGRRDLNSRLPAPKAGALPGCATPRCWRVLLSRL